MPRTLSWTAPAAPERLDRALTKAFPELSRSRIQSLINAGAVTVADAPADASAKLPAGTVVTLVLPDPVSTELKATELPLTILYEDAHVLVLDKAAGMVVHPAPGHPDDTLVNALLYYLREHGKTLPVINGEERPGIVHRLDAGTSGVMIVALTDKAHRRLSKQFAIHSIDRRYYAVVHRVPLHDNGTIRSELGRDPQDRLRYKSMEGGREAVTHWSVRGRGDRISLVECRLETGRTHQIRVHLSEAGHPIVGDRTYGRRDCTPTATLRPMVEALTHPLLHAWHLGFTHPVTGEVMAFSTPPPADFQALCAAAGLKIPAIV